LFAKHLIYQLQVTLIPRLCRFKNYLLAERLKKLPDLTVGAINHPQSNMADFYRELGDIFAVPLRPSNRWGGAGSMHCASGGSIISNQAVAGRFCSSMKRRK
jgi:hypothetical protein